MFLFVCTCPATVEVLIYYSPQLWRFLYLATLPSNRTTRKSFCPSYLTWYTAAWSFLSNLALKMRVLGKYFSPRKLQFPQELHLTSVTSLWMVNVRPTIQKNSCSILALPVVHIWDFSCGNMHFPSLPKKCWGVLFSREMFVFKAWLQHLYMCMQTKTHNMFLFI